MRLINDAGIDAVHHGEETHTADDDGVFDLPDDVGQHLLGFAGDGWQQADDADDTDDDQADDADSPAPRRRSSGTRRRSS